MNKFFKLVVFVALLLPITIVAQEASTAQNPNTEYPILENKLKKSNEDVDNPKKNISAKFWLSRADLMMDIYNVNRSYIEGQQQLTIKFSFGKEKEIRTEEKNGELYETYVYDRVNVIYKNGIIFNYDETQKIFESPLSEAKKCLDKSQELDIEAKSTKKIKEAYIKLSELYAHSGSRAYFFDNNKEEAYNCFVVSLDINGIPVVQKVDTSLMFNTGYIANSLDKPAESIKYFDMALKYNYPEPRTYAYLKQAYFALGDTVKGLEVLQLGFSKYPESQDIVVELINYYLSTGKGDEALNYLKIAQQKDPSNISLIFAEATLYDKKGEFDKAVEMYDKTVAMDANYFNGYYNKAVLYYNRAQQYYKDADNASISEYKKIQELGDAQFLLAVEPMKKCMQLLEANPNKSAEDAEALKTVYETLKSIYVRIKKIDPSVETKIQEINVKLGK